MTPAAPPDADPARRTVIRLRALLGAATALMLALSWPLWTASDATFPRVPFLPHAAWPGEPPAVAWAMATTLLIAIALGAGAPRGWRWGLGTSVALLTLLVIQDQHRFQPWVYQYLMLALLLLALPPGQAVRYARWWFVGIYFHSALSKLDVAFTREMGVVFLTGLLKPLGIDPAHWPDAGRTAAILTMPLAELAVAVLLAMPQTRRAGTAGAIALHAALIAILGPWGLAHSTIVLTWNAVMILELLVLFGPELVPSDPTTRTAWFARPVQVMFWLAMIAPFGERWGLLDAWPAHALYASHAERTAVFLFEADRDAYPDAVRRHVARDGEGPWRRLDLTGWSRDVRGTPVYPSARACNGLAEALAARYGGPHPVRLLQWGRADRWTGRRTLVECLGLDAIQRQGDRYWANAHPGPERSQPVRDPRRTCFPGPPPRSRRIECWSSCRVHEMHQCLRTRRAVERTLGAFRAPALFRRSRSPVDASLRRALPCGCREPAESCSIPRRSPAASASATSAPPRTRSSTF